LVIIVDESNIHRQDGKSTIALLYLPDLDALEHLNQTVLQIERTLKINPFHWAGSNWRVRDKFVAALMSLKPDFRIKLAVMTNPVNIDRSMELALGHLITERQLRRIIIDGAKPKHYTARLKKTLRDKGITVRKLRTEDDKETPALRVADAVAGLARHHIEHPTGRAASLYRSIRRRIDIVVEV